MKTKRTNRAILYGTLDSIFGFILILVQTTVTYYCDNFYPGIIPRLSARVRPDDSLLNLGLASAGIWTGFLFLLAGCLGICSGLKRRRPAVGVQPARDSYSKLIYGFFVCSVLSAIFSTILIAVSTALSAEWFVYLLDPPLILPELKEVATIVGSLGLVMVVIGLAALPVHCIASYISWTDIQRSRTVGRVIYSGGPPRTLRPDLRVKNADHRMIEVVTRPASQINTLSHSLSVPQMDHSLSVPQMHELSRNPSFHSAVRNPSQSSTWSYDF